MKTLQWSTRLSPSVSWEACKGVCHCVPQTGVHCENWHLLCCKQLAMQWCAHCVAQTDAQCENWRLQASATENKGSDASIEEEGDNKGPDGDLIYNCDTSDIDVLEDAVVETCTFDLIHNYISTFHPARKVNYHQCSPENEPFHI